jgi:hypothetical protein
MGHIGDNMGDKTVGLPTEEDFETLESSTRGNAFQEETGRGFFLVYDSCIFGLR